jgi:glycerophosphoryl diester phosphodiesterase
MSIRWFFVLSLAAYSQDRQIVAIAHRGEHLHHPENTIPAYAEAIRVGVDFIEVDVRTSADGKLVLSHDNTVDRCTNGKGKVAEMTFDELQALDAGARAGLPNTRIPTFDQALALAHDGGIGVYVDVKDAAAFELVKHIERHGMADRVVMYCDLKMGKQIVALNPNLKVMPEANSDDHVVRTIDELHPRVIAFTARDFTAAIIAIAKKSGARIYVDRMGLTDAAAGWQSAIDSGADGIQTDKPAELFEYLRSRKYKKPK